MLSTLIPEAEKIKEALQRAKDNPKKKPWDIKNLENKLEGLQGAIKKCKDAVDLIID